jgi:tripartite-type tricarboxylate transporter receptor subunit TctC
MHRRLLISLVSAGLAQPAVLRAQGLGAGFPDRPIRLIVAWQTGGSADTIARLFQSRLSQVLGRSIMIENRGGAAGSMGAAEANRAPNDGSVWLFVYDTFATNETVMELPFRALEAFVPVCHVASAPLVMVTHPSTLYRSFQDVVNAAKRAPDTINFASSSTGGLPHVATVLLQQQGGFRLVHQPYRGTVPAMEGILSGAVPLFIAAAVALSQPIRAGLLRPLGVTTRLESRHLPGTRSFAQQGFADFEAPTWWGMLARSDTPAPLVRQMNEALVQVLNEPAVKARIEEQGCDIVASTPSQYGQFLAGEIEKWGRVIRANGITADS